MNKDIERVRELDKRKKTAGRLDSKVWSDCTLEINILATQLADQLEATAVKIGFLESTITKLQEELCRCAESKIQQASKLEAKERECEVLKDALKDAHSLLKDFSLRSFL
jgi:hypothetical protein